MKLSLKPFAALSAVAAVLAAAAAGAQEKFPARPMRSSPRRRRRAPTSRRG